MCYKNIHKALINENNFINTIIEISFKKIISEFALFNPTLKKLSLKIY